MKIRHFFPRLSPRRLVALALLLAGALPSLRAQQQGGDLAPGAGPAATMKSLAEIDPGIAIQPGDFGVGGFTISGSGSYYLTGDVTIASGSSSAITIAATVTNVALDLRGFSITFSGASSIGSAITLGAGVSRVSIINGKLTGGWNSGVAGTSATDVTCRNLQITGSKQFGIRLGPGARVIDCHIDGGVSPPSTSIQTAGIFCDGPAQVSGCFVRRCDGSGITAGTIGGAASVTDCVAYDNGDAGIACGDSGLISRCVSAANTSHGISVSLGSRVLDCVADSNDGNGIDGSDEVAVANCSARMNALAGISLGSRSSVADSNAKGNTGAGFELGAFSATVSRCAAFSNGGDGFVNGYHASDCIAFQNTGEGFDGIAAARHCVAVLNGDNGFSGNVFHNCLATDNGTAPLNTSADGFELTADGSVRDSRTSINGGHGIRATGSNNEIRGNSVTGNTGDGINLASSSNLVILNLLGSNGGAAVSLSGGNIAPVQSASTSVGTIHPFANFQ